MKFNIIANGLKVDHYHASSPADAVVRYLSNVGYDVSKKDDQSVYIDPTAPEPACEDLKVEWEVHRNRFKENEYVHSSYVDSCTVEVCKKQES